MTLTVLVVEDEAVVAIDLECVLEDLGHKVIGAGRLAEAMAAAHAMRFDFAVLDVNLNGEYSYPLAELLREQGVPFVFVTGYGAEGLAEEWRDARVFQKPVQRGDLAALLAAQPVR